MTEQHFLQQLIIWVGKNPCCIFIKVIRMGVHIPDILHSETKSQMKSSVHIAFHIWSFFALQAYGQK